MSPQFPTFYCPLRILHQLLKANLIFLKIENIGQTKCIFDKSVEKLQTFS